MDKLRLKLKLGYELKLGEVVVWSEQSNEPIMGQLGCLLWITCFIFWFYIYESFFVAVVLCIFSSCFFDFLVPQKQNPVYMITNLRAISWCPTDEKFISHYPAQLKNFEVKKNTDGTGSIVFIGDDRCSKSTIKNSFINISNVNSVKKLLERLANSKAYER